MTPHLFCKYPTILLTVLSALFLFSSSQAVVRLTDPGTEGDPVAGQSLSLTFPDEQKEEKVKTDEKGILYWPDDTLISSLPKGTTFSGGLAHHDVADEFIHTELGHNGDSMLPHQDQYQGMEVGPNSKVGSGANLKKKATGMVVGSAMSSLGGFSKSSGGFGFGGGSKSSKKKGPKTVKDPTHGDFISLSNGGIELDVRTGFTKDGFVVSSKLNKAPGDGTFHAMWLEDGQGKRIFPYKYLIISIYRNWTLTVSWTYDHWTNGVHDEHREGGWVETGSDHLGDYPVNLAGEENISKSIWYTNGFDTAVNGINHLGSVFRLSREDFVGKGPMHLVTHITEPNKTPVVSTVPVVGELFASKPSPRSARDLIVLVRPQLVH